MRARTRYLLHSPDEEDNRVDHVWLEFAIQVRLVPFFQVVLAASHGVHHAPEVKRKLQHNTPNTHITQKGEQGFESYDETGHAQTERKN